MNAFGQIEMELWYKIEFCKKRFPREIKFSKNCHFDFKFLLRFSFTKFFRLSYIFQIKLQNGKPPQICKFI